MFFEFIHVPAAERSCSVGLATDAVEATVGTAEVGTAGVGTAEVETLFIEQLKPGERYEVVITTCTGL